MNGLYLLHRLRDESGRLPCAVVMLTAYGGEELAVQAMKAGASDYIAKAQVGTGHLPHRLANAIEKFQMQRRLERQHAALERSERRYGSLLEAMPQMVWTADGDGCVKYANRRWLEYTGLSLRDASHFGWDHALAAEDRDRTWSAWQSAKASATPFEIEHRLRRASDGSYRWHLVRGVPMKNGNGLVSEWFGTCTEIESQKQAERESLQREMLAGLGLMAGGIAHDFNNLLVVILGGAILVRDDLDAEDPNRSILQNVIRASERAAELTRKMLAYSGKGAFAMERVDVGLLALEACEAVRKSLPERIHLQYQGGDGLPAVKTDSEQLRKVIVDLVTNAVESIDTHASGTICVRTRLAEPCEEMDIEPEGETVPMAGLVSLEVQDTGCGMDDATMARVFDPFFSTKFTGRGLSLAAVKGFVGSSGGTIRVQSQPGSGTTFQLLLPAVAEKRAAS